MSAADDHPADVILSQLGGEADFAEIIEHFLVALSDRLRQIDHALETDDLDGVGRLSHQLKGAAGGYGFPGIGEAAWLVEQQVEAGEPLATVAESVGDLAELCRRAIAGRKGGSAVR